jgi:DNA-binding helix-hairpin-helix protein with protein kinase domain
MIKSGSEASIYLSDNGLAFKIYDKRPKTEFLHKKIMKMLEYDKFYQGVAWPLSIAKNKEGKFIGYSMAYFSGVRLAQLLTNNSLGFNHLTRLQKNQLLIRICLSLIETLLKLHQQNILVGDINANNILVKFDGQVFLVDTDSFQIGYYPSQMGTKLYYSPEFKQVNKTNYLRSFGTESYSIGFLLSRIISTPNASIKPPKYFQQTIDGIAKSIFSNNFYQEEDALQFMIKHIDSLFKTLPDFRYTTSYYKDIIKMYYSIINNLKL